MPPVPRTETISYGPTFEPVVNISVGPHYSLGPLTTVTSTIGNRSSSLAKSRQSAPDASCVTGDSDLTVAALRSLIGGTEATGHEADEVQKKTQWHQIRPMFARPGTRQGHGVKQPQVSRQSGVIITPSMSLLTGIAQNRAWPSTGSWSCVIALISNLVDSPPGPSIRVLAQCAGSSTRVARRRSGSI
jgi:hypothetical protein